MNNIKMIIAVRKDLTMKKGKLASQVAHAAMKFIYENNNSSRNDVISLTMSVEEAVWFNTGATKIVVSVNTEDELKELMFKAELNDIPVYPVIDAGHTEFNGIPTLTCAAFGPCAGEELDKITGHLKLL